MLKNNLFKTFWRFTSTSRFAWGIIGLFVVEALWIALSARYPMASDEDFHFGIIQIYSHQLSPFFAAQPAGADAFGAIVRDASYLQHYIMSFPLRLFRAIGLPEAGQIIGLRLFSIAFAAGAIEIFRRVLLRTSLTTRLTNFVLLIFVLIPIFPFVAAQVNYDNMFLCFAALGMLLCLKIADEIRHKQVIPPQTFILFASLGLLNCLVKFAYLPLLFGMAIYVVGVLIASRHIKVILKDSWRQFMVRSRRYRIMMLGLLLLSIGLFTERYAYNVATYKTLTPECDTVLSIEKCQQYGPWVRNYKFKTLYYENRQQWNLVEFSQNWHTNYGYSLLFTLNGPFSNYTIGKPLPIIYKLFEYAFYIAVIPLLWSSWKLWRSDKTLRFLLCLGLLYVGVLFLQNYGDFKDTGQAVAQQGRYLLPVLIIFLAWIARCFQMMFSGKLAPYRLAYYGMGILIMAAILQGGGATTFIVRSHADWYWQNSYVDTANAAARSVLKPLLIGD